MNDSEITSGSSYHGARQASMTFAPEIETAAIALCWREPERLAIVKRELDPAVHFIQPALRYLLEAIDLAWRELGTLDFACVIQVLRELGKLEEAGGLEGASDVWREGEFLDSPIWKAGQTEKLLADYLELLKGYALSRQDCSAFHPFTGGKVTLWLNKVRRWENDPDFIGEARVAGRRYVAKAWNSSDGEFLNIRLEPIS
jgi:hypothetical protein